MIRPNKTHMGALALAVSAVLATPAQAAETSVKVGGYIKFDAITSDYSQPAGPGWSVHRDFLVPSLMPTGTDETDGDGKKVTDFHAKQSRFNLKTKTTLDNGDVVKGLIEMDFGPGFDTSNGERGTNRSGVDLRHAAIFYKGWTFGQTWTNLLNGASLAETLNFFPLPEGTISVRQAQIRYTTGPFSVSLENPLTRVRGAAGDRETDDGTMPDITAKYTHKADWGIVSVGAAFRKLEMEQQIVADDPATPGIDESRNVDDSVNANLFNVSGRIKTFGKDDLRFSISTGEGIGRYIGLAINDDALVTANYELETIDATAYSVAYRHMWSPKLRSTLGYSNYEADDTGDVGVNKESSTTAVNLIYSPNKSLTLGAEFMHAELEKEGGNKGEVDRVQFSAKYAF